MKKDDSTLSIELSHIRGAPVLVAGSGRSAIRRVEPLLEAGARIHLVTPELDEMIEPYLGRLEIVEVRAVHPEDVIGKRLVLAATRDRKINRELAFAARWHGVLVNVAGDREASDFLLASQRRRASR
jgi:siroheme synthase-like protein